MTNLERVLDLVEIEGAIVLHGLDAALIGYGSKYPDDIVLVYSAAKIKAVLVERDGMTVEEAEEFFSFNIACLGLGERTPIIMQEI